MMFVELGTTISFAPYRVLPSVHGFDTTAPKRRILVDVGTNGFLASAKYLVDMYMPHMPFTHAFLIEPHTEHMELPPQYTARMNITVLHRYVDVGSRDVATDLLLWLEHNVHADDFVALKFDVDEPVPGATIEWGFLADLYSHPSVGLVDELYIEMHFNWLKGTCGPKARCEDIQWMFSWSGKPHTMEQAYTLLTELRRCGLAVHAWP